MVPEGWQASTLGECVSIRSGGTPSKQKPEFWGGTVPWVSAKDLKTHLISDAQDHLTDQGAEQAKMAAPDSVLMLVRGMTLLKDVPIGFVTKPVAFNQDLKALVANDSVAPKFLSYLLVAKKLQMMGLVNTANHGTGRLDTDLLKALPVDIPPLPEQRKIADILSTWDAAIEKTETLLATAKAQKRALMQSLLTGRRRFPEFEVQDWKEVRLGDVASVDASSLGSKTPKDFEFGYISLSNVEPGRIVGPLERMVFGEAPSRARRKVRAGDLLVSTVRPNLSGFARVSMQHADCIASTGFAVVSPRRDADGSYLFHYLFSHQMAGQFHALVVGSNYPAINSTDVRKLRIKMPSIEEQQKIGTVLNDCDVEISALADGIQELRTEKKALMQQLLTGKRRVVV